MGKFGEWRCDCCPVWFDVLPRPWVRIDGSTYREFMYNCRRTSSGGSNVWRVNGRGGASLAAADVRIGRYESKSASKSWLAGLPPYWAILTSTVEGFVPTDASYGFDYLGGYPAHDGGAWHIFVRHDGGLFTDGQVVTDWLLVRVDRDGVVTGSKQVTGPTYPHETAVLNLNGRGIHSTVKTVNPATWNATTFVAEDFRGDTGELRRRLRLVSSVGAETFDYSVAMTTGFDNSGATISDFPATTIAGSAGWTATSLTTTPTVTARAAGSTDGFGAYYSLRLPSHWHAVAAYQPGITPGGGTIGETLTGAPALSKWYPQALGQRVSTFAVTNSQSWSPGSVFDPVEASTLEATVEFALSQQTGTGYYTTTPNSADRLETLKAYTLVGPDSVTLNDAGDGIGGEAASRLQVYRYDATADNSVALYAVSEITGISWTAPTNTPDPPGPDIYVAPVFNVTRAAIRYVYAANGTKTTIYGETSGGFAYPRWFASGTKLRAITQQSDGRWTISGGDATTTTAMYYTPIVEAYAFPGSGTVTGLMRLDWSTTGNRDTRSGSDWFFMAGSTVHAVVRIQSTSKFLGLSDTHVYLTRIAGTDPDFYDEPYRFLRSGAKQTVVDLMYRAEDSGSDTRQFEYWPTRITSDDDQTLAAESDTTGNIPGTVTV